MRETHENENTYLKYLFKPEEHAIIPLCLFCEEYTRDARKLNYTHIIIIIIIVLLDLTRAVKYSYIQTNELIERKINLQKKLMRCRT